MSVKILPVILSGGSGTRLWPISRAGYPKQFHDLIEEGEPLMVNTLKRVSSEKFYDPIIIANEDHRFMVAELLLKNSLSCSEIILEPEGRNTAPAIAVASHYAIHNHGEDTILLVLPSDHIIEGKKDFEDIVLNAVMAVEEGYLTCFGITPDSPDTGYGYIKHGKAFRKSGTADHIDRFVEKPTSEEALEYLDKGNYSWNSGIFMFGAASMINELEKLQSEIADYSKQSLSLAKKDMDFLRLDEDEFKKLPDISIDYALMEKTDNAVVVKAGFDWCDIGSFSKLWNMSPKDENNNVTIGDSKVFHSKNNFVKSEGHLVAALGVEDLIIVAEKDVTLVANKKYDQQIKELVADLMDSGKSEVATHKRVFRPWGIYEVLFSGRGYKIKLIEINPGEKISLQKHEKRSEHWTCIEGEALVTKGQDKIVLKKNESAFIPMGVVHRLENSGDDILKIIEIQTGDYLDEDDIIRLEDDYKRDT